MTKSPVPAGRPAVFRKADEVAVDGLAASDAPPVAEGGNRPELNDIGPDGGQISLRCGSEAAVFNRDSG